MSGFPGRAESLPDAGAAQPCPRFPGCCFMHLNLSLFCR